MKLSQTRIAIALAVLVVTSSGCGLVNRIRAKNELNEAARTYREGHFDEAEQHSRRALELDPTSKTAPSFIARTIHAQYRPGVQSPENLAKAEEAIRAYQQILQKDPKNEEAYKAIAYLYGATKQEDKLRSWISARANDTSAEPERRAEAYIVLASKDWDCSFKITELPANKTTTLNPGNRATVSYKKPSDQKEFDNARACVKRGLEEIVENVANNHPQANLDLLRRAYLFSAREHKGQKRASGESYLVHPLEVANILADMRLDAVSVSTGLLHDVVEDTLVDVETIREYFGDEVAQLVGGLTKIAHISSVSREEQQAENVRKMLLAMVDDVRVVLVKLADRLHNMRTLEYLDAEKRRRISQETMDIYAPIAHRLGMGKLRGELEDLAFKNLHPEDYRDLTAQMEKRRAANEAFLNDVTATIQEKMQETGVPFVRIEGRVKRLYSIWKKLGRQEIELDQVYDLVAARVITPDEIRDCYAALGVIHTTWKPVPGRFKDWIATPRDNLYQSLHTSVIGSKGQPFEIQIRTEQMHLI